MKYFICILFPAILLVFMGCSGKSDPKFSLSAAQFSEKISQTPGAQIIDVRTPDEYVEAHMINAKNFDWEGHDFNDQIKTLDKSKPVFVYCKIGERSEAAAKKLRSKGFKEVYQLSGGIKSWEASRLPETTNTTIH